MRRPEHATSSIGDDAAEGLTGTRGIGHPGQGILPPMKLAVLSRVLPPSPWGQVVALYRVLRDLDASSYCLISSEDYETRDPSQNPPPNGSTPRLPARYYHLPAKFYGLRNTLRSRLGRERGVVREANAASPPPASTPTTGPEQITGLRAARAFVGEILMILQRALGLVRIIKREGSGALLTLSGDPFDLPAGYLAGLWTRVPVFVYLFDDYLYQWKNTPHEELARLAEPLVLRGAAGVIVPNEFLRDEYRRRYGGDPTVIHNPCEVAEREDTGEIPWPAEHGEVRIVYTGAVYDAHYDAFRNLVAAIGQLGREDVRLHLYTAQPLGELEREGIVGPVVYHDHLPASKVSGVQRRADILFLPLAFISPNHEIVKTSSPGKMGEYLASGRPVLAHAPADSFVSWYFREHECGVVVDRGDPAMLAREIHRLLEDRGLRATVVENARISAASDFSVESARSKFLKMLEIGVKR